MVIRDLNQRGPSNRGGSYVKEHRYESTPSGGHALYVPGPLGAVAQVQLVDSRYVKRKWETIDGHVLDGAGSCPVPATSELLDLLQGAVTVPCQESVDFAIALDWFKTVVDGGLAGYTELAELVTLGKRYIKQPAYRDELREIGTAIVGEMVDFIAQHPLLRGIDVIAAPPGHDARVLSFGSSLAYAVARDRHVGLIRCTSAQEYRVAAKDMELADRSAALRGHFNCPTDVSGQRVLIVDDVYSTGETAQETARVLRAAGAVGVASLTAVRTMQSL
jgi:adenine/guanine phosphoribosyltransferase-like PRPP-binding protein